MVYYFEDKKLTYFLLPNKGSRFTTSKESSDFPKDQFYLQSAYVRYFYFTTKLSFTIPKCMQYRLFIFRSCPRARKVALLGSP